MDVSAALNIYVIWTTENGAGDTCLWRVRYQSWASEAGVIDSPDTALDTPIADDTAVQFSTAKTAAGVINGATFSQGDLVILDLWITDCNNTGTADLVGYGIQYSKQKP